MTERLYYDHPYQKEFDAVVTAVRVGGNGQEVALNRSAFYPTSGGQPFDLGTLGALPVSDVYVDEGGEVWHVTGGTLRVGDAVHGEIDWARRFDHMQQHAGEHMIAGAVWRLYGGSTIGLHLGAEFSTIDVTMPGGETHLSPDQILAVESDVNHLIQQDIPIRCWFPDEAELKALPLRKAPTVSEHIRVAAIGDSEMVACGGTHPASAGQIGLVKIIDARPCKGKLRIAFLCGMRAVRNYQAVFNASGEAAALLSAKPEQLPQCVTHLKDTISALQHELSEAQKKQALAAVQSLLASADVVNGVRLVAAVLPEMNLDALRSLAVGLIEEAPAIALLAAPKPDGFHVLFARSEGAPGDMGKLLREAAARFGAKGGGRSDFAQGSSTDAGIIEYAASLFKNNLI